VFHDVPTSRQGIPKSPVLVEKKENIFVIPQNGPDQEGWMIASIRIGTLERQGSLTEESLKRYQIWKGEKIQSSAVS
jgi:hypothetical protein